MTPKPARKMATMVVGIAGITGKFANFILNSLLSKPNVTIRGYCRNASKLRSNIISSPRVSIVEGDSSDIKATHRFVRGCDVIYAAI